MTSLEIQDLKEATLRGDVEFLKKCVNSKQPMEFYSTFFPKEEDQPENFHHGNIFHMAAWENREEFIRELIGILSVEDTQRLLVQPMNEARKWNPLHVAARVGNAEIVKMFLDVYTSLIPSDLSKRPWLLKDSRGCTPCHTALYRNNEECAVLILRMDKERFCNMIHEARGSNIIYEALIHKSTKLALEILTSPHPIGCIGNKGFNPFHVVPYMNCSEGIEIFQLLLQRTPDLIKQSNPSGGDSVFHKWAAIGKLWPFQCLLESNNTISDVKSVLIAVAAQADHDGDNPLHYLAKYSFNEEVAIEIAAFLVNIYKQEGVSTQSSSEDKLPWLLHNNEGDTPLSLAIDRGHEKFAMFILLLDENAAIKGQKNVLFLAIERECHDIAEKLLEIMGKHGWTQLLSNHHKNVLHLAPLCKKELCTLLIQGHHELLNGVDKGGMTIVHSWIISGGKEWLFEFILNSKWRNVFTKLISAREYNHQNNVFHVAATTSHEETIQTVQLLVKAYKEDFPSWRVNALSVLPWFAKNKENEGPLHLAIRTQHQEFASYILSLYQDRNIGKLLDYYHPKHSILFLAMQNKCLQIAKQIMERLDKSCWSIYLRDPSNGQNILHYLPANLEDEELGAWLVNEVPELIIEKDKDGQSPWEKACKNGQIATLRAFINHDSGAFRDFCVENNDSPLHHIKLNSLTGYKEFFKIEHMKDFINLQNSQGLTPLHRAIRNKDLRLTEILLSMDKILYDIKDDENESAIDMLAEACAKNEKKAWERMCQRIGLDPSIKTTYFKSKKNLLDVRNSLFVVAALLATITFTAGFTLPGGFNQETGAALLANKKAFLVFLLSDTLAFFFSMLVLICLIWSMVYDSSKSLVLINRSMVLLRVALICTMLAFMTGVCAVISPTSSWMVSILIIVIMSILIGISVNRNILFAVLEYLDKFTLQL